MFERINVKKLNIYIGLDQTGKMVGQSFSANETKKIYVYPGRYAAIETTTPSGDKTVQEFNFGQFGWEYVIDDATG